MAATPAVFAGVTAGPGEAATGSLAFGDATPQSAPPGNQLNARLTGIASTPDHSGYWLVGADGGVFNYGDAGFYGSGVGASPYPVGGIVGIAPTPDGRGYWMADLGARTFHFGDAPTRTHRPGCFPMPRWSGSHRSPR